MKRPPVQRDSAAGQPAAAPSPAAQRREFIRRNHPDRGGDPQVFARGLAQFAVGGEPVPAHRVTVHRRNRWSPPGLLQAWRIHRRRRRVGRRILK